MTRHLLIVGAAIAALSVTACNKPAAKTEGAATPAEQAATPDANPAATVPTPSNEAAAVDFVPKAAAGDMFEITISKIAQKRSTNAQVKKFAGEMIKAHTASTDALKKAITESGQTYELPTALPANLQGKVDDLNKADDKSFDKVFADLQAGAHQDTLNLMQRYAEDGDVPAIKAFAAATAPVVQQHLEMAKGLQGGMK